MVNPMRFQTPGQRRNAAEMLGAAPMGGAMPQTRPAFNKPPMPNPVDGPRTMAMETPSLPMAANTRPAMPGMKPMAGMPQRFDDFGPRRLAQALLRNDQPQQVPGAVAPETPQVPAQVAGANPAQPAPVTPEMMSLMLTGRPDPNFSAQNYYNQGITPQHTGEGMIDPRFMVPPGQGPVKTSWLDQINAMMARPTQ